MENEVTQRIIESMVILSRKVQKKKVSATLTINNKSCTEYVKYKKLLSFAFQYI